MIKHTICVRVSADTILLIKNIGKDIKHTLFRIMTANATALVLVWIGVSLLFSEISYGTPNKKPLTFVQMIQTGHISSYWTADFLYILSMFAIIMILGVLVFKLKQLIMPKLRYMWRCYRVNVHDEIIQLKRNNN